MKLLLIALISIFSLNDPVSAQDAETIYVLDPSGRLSSSERQTLETLCREHDLVSEQTLTIQIRQSGSPSLEASEIGRPENVDNSALISIDLQENRAWMEMGIRLDPLLSQDEIHHWISEFLLPHLHTSALAAGLSQVLLKVLEAVESPLIPNGKATEILEPISRELPQSGEDWLLVFIIVGIVIFLFLFYLFCQPEVHFSSEGIGKVNPVQLYLFETWIQIREGRKT